MEAAESSGEGFKNLHPILPHPHHWIEHRDRLVPTRPNPNVRIFTFVLIFVYFGCAVRVDLRSAITNSHYIHMDVHASDVHASAR